MQDRVIDPDKVVDYFEAMADLQAWPRIPVGGRKVIDTRGFEVTAIHLDIAEELGYPMIVDFSNHIELVNISPKFEMSFISGQLEKYGLAVKEYARLLGQVILKEIRIP